MVPFVCPIVQNFLAHLAVYDQSTKGFNYIPIVFILADLLCKEDTNQWIISIIEKDIQ